MIVGTGFVALLTAAAAQKFLAAEIQRDVDVAVDDVHLTEAEILEELRKVRDQLDRLTVALARGRSDSQVRRFLARMTIATARPQSRGRARIRRRLHGRRTRAPQAAWVGGPSRSGTRPIRSCLTSKAQQ